MVRQCWHWPSVNLEIAKNIFWEYWLKNLLSYFPGTKTSAKFMEKNKKILLTFLASELRIPQRHKI